jgi:energy-converting hydrogenase A subunit J
VISAASEIPLFVTVAAIAIFTRSFDISDIVAYQVMHGPLMFLAFPAAVAMFLVIANAVVDIVYIVLDPRIRQE